MAISHRTRVYCQCGALLLIERKAVDDFSMTSSIYVRPHICMQKDEDMVNKLKQQNHKIIELQTKIATIRETLGWMNVKSK